MKQILENFCPGTKFRFNVRFYIILFFIGCAYFLYGRSNNYYCTENTGVPMFFKTVAETFEKIGAVSSRTEITKLLAELLKKASAHEAECICYLSLGMLRPSYNGGTQFNMAEKSLIKVVASLFNLSPETVERKTKELGDLGLVIDEYEGWESTGHVTILQVHEKLIEIEHVSGTGSQEEKYGLTLQLLQQLDPLSAKYVVRMMLGKLRLGFSDMTIIDALSWMEVGDKSLHKKIEDAYNICADIGLIARTIKEKGVEALEHMQSTIGIPIRMAAAERLPDAQSICEKLGHCIAQPKLDGFRLQIHLDKSDSHKPFVKLFSRNLLDMTSMFPDVAEEFLKLDVKQLICEGEAIVYDPHTGVFVPFQETVKRKRKHGIEQAVSDYPLQVFLFDILYCDGENLMDKPHYERRERLMQLVQSYVGVKVQIIPEITIDSAQQLEHYLLKNIDAGLEGVMVKKINSIYQPGKRNFNWIKFKRITQSQLEDTIDCVVLGYYQGSGRRVSLGIGAFLVGVYNKRKDCFQTIAKVGTGLKDEGWIEFKKRADALKVPDKGHNIECPKELFPDVWVQPTIVCTVRADEITMSPLHTAGKTEQHLGFALRFPRFIDYRIDKASEQSTSPDEIKNMYEDQLHKS
jgi:DNA ligase 1